MNLSKCGFKVFKYGVLRSTSACVNLNRRYGDLTSTQNVVSSGKKPDWNRAVSEAEKIVGYPTSFLSLRWLLSDEIANIALHLRKLIGSNHPLLKTAKGLIYNGKNNTQAWGLIVLLISKAAGHTSDIPDLEQDKAAGVLYSQRALAEVTEMIRTSHLVHKGMINMQPGTDVVDKSGELMFGNKMALLSGDYLLSNCCAELAALRNQELNELISSALRDLSEAEFVGPRDRQNNPLPSKPRLETIEYKVSSNNIDPMIVGDALGDAQAEWTLRHVLNAGSLLGKACQGTLMLAGHPEEMQEKGYLFGKHLALAWQACLDREPFLHGSSGSFSLVSAPVMFQLQYDPGLYAEIEKGIDNVEDVDFDLVRREVMKGPGLEKTKALQREHSFTALEMLNCLPQSIARTALANIIVAMQDV